MSRQDRDRGTGMRLTERTIEVNSLQRKGEAYRKQRSVIRSEDDVGGRAMVNRDEKRVLRGG